VVVVIRRISVFSLGVDPSFSMSFSVATYSKGLAGDSGRWLSSVSAFRSWLKALCRSFSSSYPGIMTEKGFGVIGSREGRGEHTTASQRDEIKVAGKPNQIICITR
jgi:hypothetical protein